MTIALHHQPFSVVHISNVFTSFWMWHGFYTPDSPGRLMLTGLELAMPGLRGTPLGVARRTLHFPGQPAAFSETSSPISSRLVLP